MGNYRLSVINYTLSLEFDARILDGGRFSVCDLKSIINIPLTISLPSPIDISHILLRRKILRLNNSFSY